MGGRTWSIIDGITGLAQVNSEPVGLAVIEGTFQGLAETLGSGSEIADIVRKLD